MTANASQIGLSSELTVILEAINNGYQVLQPIGNYLPYDLAIDINGVIIKLQVKTLRRKGKTKSFFCEVRRMLKDKNGKNIYKRYNVNDFDFAAIVLRNESVFIIPSHEIVDKVSFFVGKQGKTERYRSAWHLLDEFAASNARWCEPTAFNPIVEEFNSL